MLSKLINVEKIVSTIVRGEKNRTLKVLFYTVNSRLSAKLDIVATADNDIPQIICKMAKKDKNLH